MWVEGLINWVYRLSDVHGVIVAFLAMGGLLSFLSFSLEKGGKAISNLIMFLIAIPCIIVMSLIKKDQRKKRLEELGEIRAYVKDNPTRAQVIIFVVVTSVCALAGIWIVWKFILSPMIGINELSQTMVNWTNKSNSIS